MLSFKDNWKKDKSNVTTADTVTEQTKTLAVATIYSSTGPDTISSTINSTLYPIDAKSSEVTQTTVPNSTTAVQNYSG